MNSLSNFIHLTPAILVLLLGIYMLFSKKGSQAHALVGRIWSALILWVAVTGLFITGGPLEIYKGYGYTHVLSVVVIIAVPLAIWAIRNKKQSLHKSLMIFCFAGTVIAGLIAVALRTGLV